VYIALVICLSIVLVIPFATVIRPDFQSVANLQTISTVLVTVEGILVGLAVIQKTPFSRVVSGFLNLMALLVSVDTLMLITLVSQIKGGNATTRVDVLAPFTMSPLDLFFWNTGFFLAGALSYFVLGMTTDFYNIRLKKKEATKESSSPRLSQDSDGSLNDSEPSIG